jgi:hypothetical protein
VEQLEKLEKILLIEAIITLTSWFFFFGILSSNNATADLIVGVWATAWTISTVLILLVGFPSKVEKSE